jgi:hypothetical protein
MARFLSRNVAFPYAINDAVHAGLAGTTADGNFGSKKQRVGSRPDLLTPNPRPIGF